MKIKKIVSIILTIIVCLSVLAVPAFAMSPRWANAYIVDPVFDKNSDRYQVYVNGKEGTTKIEISATLKEKNILGIYVNKHTSSGTYHGRTATLTAHYDMDTNKDYKVTTVVNITRNGVIETIEAES